MAAKTGVGNLIVTGLNSLGIIAVIAAALYAGEWKKEMSVNCEKLAALEGRHTEDMAKQQVRDEQQDKVVQMMNDGLLRIEGNTNTIRELLQYHMEQDKP